MIIAVGDDGQSIYGFRNAVVDNITKFEEKLGLPVHQISMLENWRSRPEILALADDLLGLNSNKTEGRTVAGRESIGKSPIIRGFHDADHEYSYIIEEIKKNYNAGFDYSHQCVIARTNKELVKIISELSKEGIPYVLKNPMKYMDNSRVQALLEFVENAFWQPEATSGYFRYLSAKYDGEMLAIKTPEEVEAEIEELKNKFLNIEDMEFEAQRAILHKYLDEIRGGDEIYESFLDEYMYTYSDIEEELRFIQDFKKYGSGMSKRMEQDYEGVVLITAHSSKGLEWDIVYNTVSGYDSKILHSSRHHDEVEETRRLLYVSMTRAREMLYVTGRYVVDGTKSVSAKDGGPTYNQFLKELYELRDMAWDPVDHEAEAAKAEKRRADYIKRREKQKQGYIDGYSRDKAASKGKTRSRELTEAEKKAYDKAILGSYQTNLPL